ncbi:haloacid dehalogenase superfamily, subfamily IA, variant 3 with third motif having DD or ED/haloacid dehalogenase superfamily, subfamily IA, variant 1 with third motif having Dx(3-4)D or Dx(3-4)E [Rosenbergiella nectarea]|uniref:Haloacid dehalogenase superfamily, subfamily IA, variant 3 with third motif having DD or ED/haloacid dehalogenase superfamily, subfamily IA, variant 1 with third motif having Dx(3-4)D or Dx(3-4)E n=1 Tax=Rosenbergiella nectarea TaxID=988801 RepID=A0A1H9FD88_9GAMM|nr:HAD family phosphatase [Rosenbergiella nectarea]SEQ35857.1 haloacid dehalogenase superfamily, subfamily IA, variant 3 with third motif having DD or ED/haloacid dehalogenase superfamily, subfamily IA, variant 1 with third motif having Dx(3-4)D or Dx(3-4)E [Rosenbergiella nectarea]
MKNKIKAVIFDMDGVLIDAKEWHYHALNRALKLFGMQIEYEQHLRRFDGLPTKEKLMTLHKEKDLPLKLFNFIDQLKQKYTLEIVETSCHPQFQHEYLLSRLALDGYKLAVASNSIRKTIEVMLSKANIIDYFDFYLSNQDVVKSKPSPDIYIKAIDKLGLSPPECLIVEDNENGIKAAKASGAHVLAIGNIEEVNYINIMNKISSLEGTQCLRS